VKIKHSELNALPELHVFFIGLGAFAASELDKVSSGYQPR
jgi:hypothetical protein